MDVGIVIILIAVGLIVIRELREKLDWFQTSNRRQTPTVEMMALKAGIIKNPRPERKSKRLKYGEDGFEDGVEVRWGRRSDPTDGTFTQVSEKDMIPFLSKHRDYALWYKVIHHDFAGGVLEWIVSQPDCPNAVATAFLRALGYEDLYGLTEQPKHSEYLYRVVEIISQRDADEGFPSDTMRDPEPNEPGWTSTDIEAFDRAAMLEQCEAAARAQLEIGRTPIYSVPRNLFSTTPNGPSLRSEYDVDETGII